MTPRGQLPFCELPGPLRVDSWGKESHQASMSKQPVHPFTKFAQEVARRAGHPVSFGVALGFLTAWMIFGPLLDYHPVWKDLFGIITGIFTFLMVFLIQNTQNRDTEALHLKLDELIRVTKNASNDLINIEDLDEEELDAIKAKFTPEALNEEDKNPPES